MKKFFGITLAAIFVFSLLMALPAETGNEVTKTGWITCTMCKGKVKEHADKGDCKMKCLEQGAKLAFYDNESEVTFVIDNTEEAKKFHHKEVELTGVFDVENKKVTMASLKMLKSEESAKGESSSKKKCPHHKHE
jgi:hypothetical protein